MTAELSVLKLIFVLPLASGALVSLHGAMHTALILLVMPYFMHFDAMQGFIYDFLLGLECMLRNSYHVHFSCVYIAYMIQ